MAFRNWKQELEDCRPPRVVPWAFIRRVVACAAVVVGLTCTALWAWPGYLLPKPWQRPGPPPEAVVVMFSCDVGGYLEPCGCTEQRWGGIARAAGYIRGVSTPKTRLIFDVGHMAGGARRWQRRSWRRYLQAAGLLEYQAVNLGPGETALSAADIRRIAAESPVPIISANVVDDATDRPIVRTHRKVLVDNLRVTAVGVMQPLRDDLLGVGVAVTDLHEALGSLLPKLRAETDVIVLLAACDESTIREIARRHAEIDVILGGRVQQASRQIELVGACRIAYHANKGQLLGRMDLQIRPDGRPGPASSTMILLDNDVPEDAEMLDLVEQFNLELAKLNREGGLEGLGIETVACGAGTNRYVGADSCARCHPQTHATWKKFGHSTAYRSLVKRKRNNNPGCVGCHVVDIGAADGFLGLSVTPDRINVQCEACHGRSGDHVRARRARMDPKTGKLSRVLPASCETCHDCIHSPEFSYTPYWKKIEHGPEADGSKGLDLGPPPASQGSE